MRAAARWTVLAAVLPALLAPACHLVYPFGVLEPDLTTSDGGRDQLNDAPDALQPPPCGASPDPSTLALYTFDDVQSPMTDAKGKHHGSVVGKPQSQPGPAGCGKALAFPSAGNDAYDYGVIPHHPDWDAVRSIDLWVRFDASNPEGYAGVLTRDAKGENLPGHLRIARMCNNVLAVRLQQPAGATNICSQGLEEGEWHHVGLNLGPPAVELVVDGKPAKPNQPTIYCTGFAYSCTNYNPTAADIAGNLNAWIVGASNDASTPGTNVASRQLHGAVDSLRISKVRRSFTKP